MPQIPGPSIGSAGTTKFDEMTRLRAKQTFSAWARQTGRSGRLKKPQPESDKTATNAGTDGQTRPAIMSICAVWFKDRFMNPGLRRRFGRAGLAIRPPHFAPKRRTR